MPAPVLVAYATRYGSTEEVAEAIAGTLREGGLTVDVAPMHRIHDLAERDAVVLGAPLYMGRLHGDASDFLREHEAALAALPVAFFALGPLNDRGEEVRGAREQLAAELDRHPLLSPISVAMFGGRFDPSQLGFMQKVVTVIPATPLYRRAASDVRDWDAIRAWAGEIAARLRPVPVPA